MKRCLIGWVLLVLIFIGGCGSSSNSGYTVLFGEPVMIFDETVYDSGMPIGKVAATEISPANKSKVIVEIDPNFSSDLAQNHVFIVKSGRLCLTKIAPFGDALESEAMLSGFASTAQLNLFRLKHLFADKVTAARNRAEKLARW